MLHTLPLLNILAAVIAVPGLIVRCAGLTTRVLNTAPRVIRLLLGKQPWWQPDNWYVAINHTTQGSHPNAKRGHQCGSKPVAN